MWMSPSPESLFRMSPVRSPEQDGDGGSGEERDGAGFGNGAEDEAAEAGVVGAGDEEGLGGSVGGEGSDDVVGEAALEAAADVACAVVNGLDAVRTAGAGVGDANDLEEVRRAGGEAGKVNAGAAVGVVERDIAVAVEGPVEVGVAGGGVVEEVVVAGRNDPAAAEGFGQDFVVE